MNDHIDIYAPGNERAWESAVRAAFAAALPNVEVWNLPDGRLGFGTAVNLRSPRTMGIARINPDTHSRDSADYIPKPTTIIQVWSGGSDRQDGATANHADPAEALRLALAEYNRQRQEVTT
jgi:hypothetical protein